MIENKEFLMENIEQERENLEKYEDGEIEAFKD